MQANACHAQLNIISNALLVTPAYALVALTPQISSHKENVLHAKVCLLKHVSPAHRSNALVVLIQQISSARLETACLAKPCITHNVFIAQLSNVLNAKNINIQAVVLLVVQPTLILLPVAQQSV